MTEVEKERGFIHVVYATNDKGLVPLPQKIGNRTPAFPSRKAANAAARRLVEKGAYGAVVVQDGTVVGRFGRLPKNWGKQA